MFPVLRTIHSALAAGLIIGGAWLLLAFIWNDGGMGARRNRGMHAAIWGFGGSYVAAAVVSLLADRDHKNHAEFLWRTFLSVVPGIGMFIVAALVIQNVTSIGFKGDMAVVATLVGAAGGALFYAFAWRAMEQPEPHMTAEEIQRFEQLMEEETRDVEISDDLADCVGEDSLDECPACKSPLELTDTQCPDCGLNLSFQE